jgi:Xaa-Pro aminopeptidase
MDGGVMLLAAAPERIRSADVHYPYRQDSDFGYVTGLLEPDAVCVLAPGAKEPFALFVRPHDPERAIWVGARAGVDGATEHYGADVAHPIADLERELPRWLRQAEHVWLDLGRDDPLANRLLAAVRAVQAERPRSGSGPTALRDAGEILHEQRLVKQPDELVILREAIGIACEAHRIAMQTTQAGMAEFEIEALVDYTFRRRGAAGPAYPSIVAGGANATVLHYTENAARLRDDQLLLLDAGDEFGGYCADVTRTFPVGATYGGAQRDLYEAVLAAQQAAIDAVRPGATLDALHAIAVRVLAEALVQLGLIEGPVDTAVEQETYKQFYMHRTSHWLGRDVHDVGLYRQGDAPRALTPGMVFTVEPGLYVPDTGEAPAAFRGIGIRIEDDVLVTDDGAEVLSADAPKDLAEIETLRASAA